MILRSALLCAPTAGGHLAFRRVTTAFVRMHFQVAAVNRIASVDCPPGRHHHREQHPPSRHQNKAINPADLEGIEL